jgi:signal recognition particle receptor subunit beta
MDWSSVKVIATTLLSGNWIAILTAVLVAVSLPLLLHHFLYRSSSAKLTNDFLLLGPSGSGKTAFCSLVLNPL